MAQPSDKVKAQVSIAFGNDFSALGTAEIEERLQSLQGTMRQPAQRQAAFPVHA